MKRKTSAYPLQMSYNGITSSENSEITDFFAQFFESTYSSASYDPNVVYPYSLSSIDRFQFSHINENLLNKELKMLKCSFSSGPDNIPSNILKYCADSICFPLLKLFNMSLDLSYFPELWKESYIIPLHKSGSKSDITNYRGIAKLSAIPKLFEKIITDQLTQFVSSQITVSQHGFIKGRSTSTNLLEFTTLVINGFKQSQQTDVIYTDFSKAFDCVNHNLLLKKMSLMGFPTTVLNWIESYLTDRKQQVLFNSLLSKYIRVSSGVTQGSHLGPIIFLLFINDLPTAINSSKVLMYADDVKLVYTFNDYNHHNNLQFDLNELVKWCDLNLMTLNLKKCKHMTFSRNKSNETSYSIKGTKLENVASFVDLGVTMDTKLRFNVHISLTVNKAKGVLGFIKRWSKEFDDPYTTKLLFTSLVRPILEYASVVWNPYYNLYIDMLESVQKQFLLFALRGLPWNPNSNLPSYENRLKLIRLPTLRSRRIMLNVTFLHKLITGEINSEMLLRMINFNNPSRDLRHFRFLRLDTCNSNYAHFSPFRCMCNDYNSLHHLITPVDSCNLIKQKLIIYLNT